MPESQPDHEEIRREQINSVFSLLPLMLKVDIAAGIILVSLVYTVTQNYSSLMWVWFGSMLAASLLRIFITNLYKQVSVLRDNLDARGHWLLVCASITGLIWGSTWLILPAGSVEPPIGAVILWPCAVIASTVASLAITKHLYFTTTAIIVAMHLGYLFYFGSSQHIQLSIALSVYSVFILFVANRISNDLNQGLKLKLQNLQLNEALGRDREILQKQETALFNFIEREKTLLAAKRSADQNLVLATEEKLLLLDSVGEGIFGTNSIGKITFVNSMALKLLGFEENEVLGQDALAIITRKNTSGEDSTGKSILACFKEGRSVTSIKGSFFGKNDNLLPVNFSCRPILKAEKFIGAVVSFFDMSEQIEMEHKLVMAQKMEVIGRITGGVAHDFNNLLTALMGNLHFLKKRLIDGDTEGGISIIDKLTRSAKRGAELNNRLLSYSREQALESKEEDLGEVLLEMQDFLRRTLSEDIKFDLQLEGASNYAMIDRAQLENLILNICLNAKDAMPGGGDVSITCKRHNQVNNTSISSNDLSGDYVQIEITDSGVGIPAAIQDKIFDPFFTTKAPGEGTGFGLSSGFGFIQQIHGSITVRSEEGAGACFIIKIPALSHSTILERVKEKTPTESGRYNGTILVVEDDADVREVATRMLVDTGYRVIAAANAAEGLEKYRMHAGIDLVFSDIVMPGGMTGIEMARKMVELDPKLPVILATGYTEKMLKDRIEGMGNVICIAKPYDTDQLPATIFSLLQQKTGRDKNH